MQSTMQSDETSSVNNNPEAVDQGDSDNFVFIVAGAAGGGGLLLCFLIIIVCCVCHRQRQKHRQIELVVSNDYVMKPLQNGKRLTGERRLVMVDEKHIEKLDLLSQGVFGSVYKGTWSRKNILDKTTVSLRVLNKGGSRISGKKHFEILASFGHPHVVSLLGLSMTSDVMLIYEFVPLGTLASYLKSHKTILTGEDLLSFSKQIVEGMSFLEAIRILHRNLSASSVLVDTPSTVKIADIALPAIVNVGESYYKTEGPTAPLKWLAPECLQKHNFSHKSDVWAFGVTLWEIMTLGNVPYKDVQINELLGLLKEGRRLPIPLSTSNSLYSIMLQCWNYTFSNRPDFQHILNELNLALENSSEYVTSPADIARRNALAGSGTESAYTELDFDQTDDKDDDGYDLSAGTTTFPGDGGDWYTASGMYISPLSYAARDKLSPSPMSLSANPMYGSQDPLNVNPLYHGQDRADSLSARKHENILYVSMETMKSSEVNESKNVLYESLEYDNSER